MLLSVAPSLLLVFGLVCGNVLLACCYSQGTGDRLDELR